MDRDDWVDVASKVLIGGGAAALVAAAGVALAKSGMIQSAVARKKRNADPRLIDSPPAGTPLLVSLGKVAEHSGIFLGRSRVAEPNGNGQLQDVSLSEFLNGQPNDLSNIRWGTRIFAACDEATGKPLTSPKIAHFARAFIARIARVKYNLFGNNCHFFTASCVQGIMSDGPSLVDWIKDGTFTIDRLQEVIGNVMNAGRPVVWLGVREPSRFFNYSLTDEKVALLRKEGRL